MYNEFDSGVFKALGNLIGEEAISLVGTGSGPPDSESADRTGDYPNSGDEWSLVNVPAEVPTNPALDSEQGTAAMRSVGGGGSDSISSPSTATDCRMPATELEKDRKSVV